MHANFRTVGFTVSILLHGSILLAAVYYIPFAKEPDSSSRRVPLDMHWIHRASPAEVAQPNEVVMVAMPAAIALPEPIINPKLPIRKPARTRAKKLVKPRVKLSRPASGDAASMVAEKPESTPIVAMLKVPEKEDLDTMRLRYRQLVLSILERNKYYPRRARRQRHEGMVQVEFTVHANGVIGRIELLASSGYQSLDKAAVGLLKKINRIDPLPMELGIKEWVFVVPLEYRLTTN